MGRLWFTFGHGLDLTMNGMVIFTHHPGSVSISVSGIVMEDIYFVRG